MSTPAPLTNVSELVLLAEELDPNKVTPGVLGFLVFAAMGLAVWALMKSMSRRVDAVRGRTFGSDEEPGATDGPGPSGESGAGGKPAAPTAATRPEAEGPEA